MNDERQGRRDRRAGQGEGGNALDFAGLIEALQNSSEEDRARVREALGVRPAANAQGDEESDSDNNADDEYFVATPMEVPVDAPDPTLATSNAALKLSCNKLVKLTEDNIDPWKRNLRQIFYACGWEGMYNKALEKRGRDGGTSAEIRKLAWPLVYSSLPDEMAADMDNLREGDVEGLLRASRGYFYKDCAGTRSRLRNDLYEGRADNFKDLNAYLQLSVSKAGRLRAMGDPLSLETRLDHLFRGLPAEYAPAINAFKLLPTKDKEEGEGRTAGARGQL